MTKNSFNSLFRKQMFFGVLVSSVILLPTFVFHIKFLEETRVKSHLNMIGSQLDADRDHLFNLILLEQEENLKEVLRHYREDFQLSLIEISEEHCTDCKKISGELLLRPAGRNDYDLFYPLDAGLSKYSSLHIVPDVDAITRRKELIFIYSAIYVCGLGFYIICMLYFSSAIRRRFIEPIHSFLQSLDERIKEGKSFHPEIKDEPKKIGETLVEQQEIEGKFIDLIGRLKDYQELLKLKEVDASLGKLAAQVAHDIRSPLSSLETATRFFGKMQGTEGAFQDHLNLLQLSSRRLRSIADDLLLSHDHQSRSSKSIFSVHHVLDELIGEYTSQKTGKELIFKKEYEGAIPCVGYRDRLQRAFGNIIKNAVEAINKNGIITLKTWTDNNFGIISISDTGCGMDPGKLSEVLKGGYTGGKKDGHGIGMVVVRETVEDHGGVLEAESTPGQGTTFRIKLPLPDSAATRGVPVTDQWSGSFELDLRPNEKIVVIDDEPSVRFQWELLLREKGFVALTYDSYEEFEKSFQESRVRSAIVDYHFDNSGFNGIEVIKRLKNRGLTNLYLCTAEYWKPIIQEQAKDLGISICPKPIPKISIKINKPSKELSNGGYRVLVIDDDKMIGLTWKSLKEQMKISDLHYFANLESFIESNIDPSSLDVAFVDVNIDNSKYDGAAVLDYLKKKRTPRVVIASGDVASINDPRFAKADSFTREKVPESLGEFLT